MENLARVLGCSILILSFARGGQCARATIRAADSVGAENLAKVLIVVRSLDGKGELDRGLTDANGLFTVPNLIPGLYQAIALYPYGYWIPRVQEFVVGDKDISVELRLTGSVIDQVPVSEHRAMIEVVDQNGTPVSGAEVLGRDLAAKYMKFSKTDTQGRATVVLPCGDAEIAVIYQGRVVLQDVKLVMKPGQASPCMLVSSRSKEGTTDVIIRFSTIP
jgi:hypothetical protein